MPAAPIELCCVAAGNGNGLHPLQVRIALHACQMVKVGGRVVYSTCTFNPVEDEAVVAEVGLFFLCQLRPAFINSQTCLHSEGY